MSGEMNLHTATDVSRQTRGEDLRSRPAERRRQRADPCESPELGLLVQAVETEVIPRLLSTHRKNAPGARLPTMDDVEQLAAHVCESDTAAAHRLIERLRADGVGIEAIYLNLLGATARMLGEMWEQDRVNFIDVTVGLCTLHQLLFRLASDSEHEPAGETGRRALFAPVPGETHVFGSLIVARFFNRAGWQTWTELSTDEALLADLVDHHTFDMVGLSISCERHVDSLARAIAMLRSHAPQATIMIGGHAVETMPGLADRVGADLATGDAAEAVRRTESFVDSGVRHA